MRMLSSYNAHCTPTYSISLINCNNNCASTFQLSMFDERRHFSLENPKSLNNSNNTYNNHDLIIDLDSFENVPTLAIFPSATY